MKKYKEISDIRNAKKCNKFESMQSKNQHIWLKLGKHHDLPDLY